MLAQIVGTIGFAEYLLATGFKDIVHIRVVTHPVAVPGSRFSNPQNITEEIVEVDLIDFQIYTIDRRTQISKIIEGYGVEVQLFFSQKMTQRGTVIDIDGYCIHFFNLGIGLCLKGRCLIVQGGQLLRDQDIGLVPVEADNKNQ